MPIQVVSQRFLVFVLFFRIKTFSFRRVIYETMVLQISMKQDCIFDKKGILLMKKIIALLLIFVLLFTFSACNGENAGNRPLRIGIIQYMSHPSLDNCYHGVMDTLEKSNLNYTIDYQVGSSNSADSDCTNFAKNMVAESYDMIIAIATPAAKAAFAATDDTDIPVVFCAVSDPIAAGLVKDMDCPGYLCTGTSDVLDLEAQVDLICGFQPNVKKIGILYTSSEDNSLTNLKNFREICHEKNLEVVAIAVQGAADIPSAAEELASKVDCINNFTDNNVVKNLKVVLSAADKYGIPVYGSEVEQVKAGCLAAVSIDYEALGRTTGNMVVEILNGGDASAIAIKTIKEAKPVVNLDVLSALGLEIHYGEETEFVTTE